MKCPIAFLWHMHQPYYRDMLTGECSMPWVRLHGIHSYYDMVRLHEEMEIGATMNFTASLVMQLKEYAQESASDVFLDHTKTPATALNTQQKVFILRHFFAANIEKMIMPHKRYAELFSKRGVDTSKTDFDELSRFFSAHDYLDIQVLYNLVWFGFKAREEIPKLNELINKGTRFTEEDKHFVIEAQREILKKLLPAIQRLAKSGCVEISTSPFFHPIIPLVIDTDIASRSQKTDPMPIRMTAPNYAEHQISSAVSFMRDFLGQDVEGMWPSEGSVCPEMIPMLASSKISWIASDEKILLSSGIHTDKSDIVHRPCFAEHDGAKVAMVFRDTELSDLISFYYYRMDGETAANDLVERIKKKQTSLSNNEPHLITIILDGENPWENYDDGGKAFLSALFEKIKKENIATTSIGNFIKNNPPSDTISKLYSGSWINANFRIWIGRAQKNEAWTYIKRTKDELDAFISPSHKLDDSSYKALLSFHAACGSDWFWWFDDDFESIFKGEFDKIFRTHLKNAFSFLKRDIPLFLFNPIHRFEDKKTHEVVPPAFIYPTINGSTPSFFEWANAVRINIHRGSHTMAHTTELFDTIYFGFNTDAFFIRLDGEDREKGFRLPQDEEMLFHIHNEGKQHKIRLFKDKDIYKLVSHDETEHELKEISFAVGSVFEMKCPFAPMGYRAGEKIALVISIVRTGVEIYRYSHIDFVVPDASYEQRMWTV